MPLDSDVANGDSQLHVEFYENRSEPDRPRPFVRIMIPGDKTNIIDQPVREDHKRRFPRQFLYFQMKNAPDAPAIGTALEIWHGECPDEFTAGQLDEMRILKFQTVEQLAQASDGQLQKIGLGAVGLREKAKAYLARKNSAENKSEIEELKAMVAQLMADRAPAPLCETTPIAVAAPKKRRGAPPGGWPKKVKTDVQHNDAPTGATGNQ